MTKAFIAEVLRESCELSHIRSRSVAGDLMTAIVNKLKRDGRFMLPGFGSFAVVERKARKALNPRTLEPVKVKAAKSVRFKVSPVLKQAVGQKRQKKDASKPATRGRRRSNGVAHDVQPSA